MQIKIRRIDKTLPLPEYKTIGSAGFDFVVCETITVPSGGVAYAPLNVCIAPPEGHMILLAGRSSLHKRGLMLANGVGIGDQDFSGNGDEYHAALYNFSNEPVTVNRGERIVQGVLKPIIRSVWHEVEDMGQEDRGGFGSTGIS